jgi:hypothetical protein
MREFMGRMVFDPSAGVAFRTKIAPLCKVTSHRTASIAVLLLGLRKP